MVHNVKTILFSLSLLLASCSHPQSVLTSASVSPSVSPTASASASASESVSVSTRKHPKKEDFINAIETKLLSLSHYDLDQYSYDQAFDSTMKPIEGKFSIGVLHSNVSLYGEKLYHANCEDRLYETPEDLLAPEEGNYTALSSHQYYLKENTDNLTFIDNSQQLEGGHTIGYAIDNKDLIHDFSFISDTFNSLPSNPVGALKDEKAYFDSLVSADPENYVYDATDPYVLKDIEKTEDGYWRYAFSIHFSTCHYGDEYYINRRFDYFMDIDNSFDLKDYGYSVEILDPVFDTDGTTVTGYEPSAAKKYVYSDLSNATLTTSGLTLSDITVTGQNTDGNDINAAGIQVNCERAPRQSYDMSGLTASDLTDSATLTKLSAALPNYLSGVTSSTMTGVLAGGATGASYSETITKQLYKDAFIKTTGLIKASPITQTTDAETEATTYTYGTEETANYSWTLKETAETITTTHSEDESTIYSFMDPLNGTSPMATFKYDGDFCIPCYLAQSAADYLDPSMLTGKISGLTLDSTKCQVQTDGSLLIVGTDYASDFAIAVKDNQISKVVETLLGANSTCYGPAAVVTKTYTLTRGEITDYQA
jgi:hypothetical protein